MDERDIGAYIVSVRGQSRTDHHQLQEDPIASQPHRFTVTSNRHQRIVEGRAAAVETARTLSRKTWEPVRVERADSGITMSFHRGDLTDYRRDPSRRRRS